MTRFSKRINKIFTITTFVMLCTETSYVTRKRLYIAMIEQQDGITIDI